MPERNQNLITGDEATDLVRTIEVMKERIIDLQENLEAIEAGDDQ